MTNSRDSKQLILASGSSRRQQLMSAAGYQFEVIPPHDSAECGICSQETPPELVARLAYQKAADVASRQDNAIVLAADTVVECCGQILGKPVDRDHAKEMLQLQRGRLQHVYTGVCVWQMPENVSQVKVDVTKLKMDDVKPFQLDVYLDSELWEGKAGGFGYQDRHNWIHVLRGSESNVVGLPMEVVETMLSSVGQHPKSRSE